MVLNDRTSFKIFIILKACYYLGDTGKSPKFLGTFILYVYNYHLIDTALLGNICSCACNTKHFSNQRFLHLHVLSQLFLVLVHMVAFSH